MLKIEFSFGLGLRENGTPLSKSRREVSLLAIRAHALYGFGGLTLIQGEGDWKDPETGVVYSETNAVLSVIVDPLLFVNLESYITNLAAKIKEELNQKAVYVVRYPVEAKLY